ncbi:MAG: hypothetical protein GC203_11055 [Phenylobacterium sp.]|uniref:hypothetical protein n=1 Tax=Phenylobacterium sp. TaxID=1871053 RepID=UPI0025E8A88B|nr:hypothetical protein [Phenylobacterium sp.]MBI1198390.1 hypothetical protein [Phenylobacterium sp.]
MLSNDGRTLLIGMAVACVSGLLMGAGLKPELDVRHEARAPQILIPHAGARTIPVSFDRGVAAYGAHVPAYVYGTDALAPPEPQIVDASATEPEPRDDPLMVYEAPETRTVQARWEEPPRRRPIFPSIDGNTPYPSDHGVAPAGAAPIQPAA